MSVEEKIDEKGFLRIFDVNPVHRDFNILFFLMRIGIFFIFSLVTFLITYIVLENMFFSFILTILLTLLLIFSFLSEIIFTGFHYSPLELNIFNYKHVRLGCIKPFRNYLFWGVNDLKDKINNGRNTLFITNRKEYIHTAIRIFKIQIFPENVDPSLNQFVRSLSSKQINFTYQVIQSPKFIKEYEKSKKKPSFYRASQKSKEILIYFSIYYRWKGKINDKSLSYLIHKMNRLTKILRSNFNSNFHHFKIILLEKNGVENALRNIILNRETSKSHDKIEKTEKNIEIKRIGCKSLFFLFYFLFFLIFSFLIEMNTWLRSLIILSMVGAYFFSVRSNLLTLRLCLKIDRRSSLQLFRPFKNISFYKMRENKGVLYIHYQDLISAVRTISLKYTRTHVYVAPGKFYRPVLDLGIPFSYTLIASPLGFNTFYNESESFIEENTKKDLSSLDTIKKRTDWLNIRAGIWRVMMIFTVQSYISTSVITEEILQNLYEKVVDNEIALKDSFEMNFPNYNIMRLNGRGLHTAFLCSLFKNKLFSQKPLYLNYSLFQGVNLKDLIAVDRELKRGIPSRIASEFEAPIHLDNIIQIGETINTENIETSIIAGFSQDQIGDILLMNVTKEKESKTFLKLVYELIKIKRPSIYFDFYGESSKIINIFKNTSYHYHLAYFILGKNFRINPLKYQGTGDKIKYIEYISDMFSEFYGLIFNLRSDVITNMRSLIAKGSEVDLSTLFLDIQDKNVWEKEPAMEEIANFIQEFSHTSSIIRSHSESDEIISVLDFLTDNRTILIDLSIFKHMKTKVFSMSLIISQILYYLEELDLVDKMFLIPRLDQIFNNHYIETNKKYDILEEIMEDIISKGIITSATSIRYLHPNAFKYFGNTITFSTTNSADISILSNITNLNMLKDGLYSKKRYNPYQIQYMMNMGKKEAIVKRSDIQQPFPIKLDYHPIETTVEMPISEINRFMDGQGYDLAASEKDITNILKKTIIEKDFEDLPTLTKPILTFLGKMKEFKNFGNYDKSKIKDLLKKELYNTLSNSITKRKNIDKLIDSLFERLLSLSYIKEDHPKMASGARPLRATYVVGPKFERALEEFYGKENEEIIIEGETISGEEVDEKPSKTENYSNSYRDFRELLKYGFKHLEKINRYLKSGKTQQALKLEKQLFDKMLIKLASQKLEGDIDGKKREEYIEYISRAKIIPFEEEEIDDLRELITQDGGEPSKASSLYEILLKLYVILEKKMG